MRKIFKSIFITAILAATFSVYGYDATDSQIKNNVYFKEAQDSQAKIDAYYNEKKNRANENLMLYDGTSDYSQCMESRQGKLLGCLSMEYKISFMKNEMRYFPGTITQAECERKLSFVNYLGMVVEGICTKWGPKSNKQYALFVAANEYFLLRPGY